MNRRLLHRWWALNAAWGCVLVAWESTLLALGLHGSWLLLPTVPVAAVQLVGWRKTRPARPRPDYARIAELERTELGIEPRSERRPDCRHEHPHEIVRVSGRVDRLCLDCGISLAFKPQPPRGRGAGSPTVR